ncbi:unnamed protein product [Citrullus colocynthis]|uniref:Secreted protein n=1 Tax=Citrullus colocynthis TaxID=252529 RepID=A0ABP0XT62_9ROSI
MIRSLIATGISGIHWKLGFLCPLLPRRFLCSISISISISSSSSIRRVLPFVGVFIFFEFAVAEAFSIRNRACNGHKNNGRLQHGDGWFRSFSSGTGRAPSSPRYVNLVLSQENQLPFP